MGIAITEQQGVICLILRLLKKHQLILVGDRDFYSIHLLFLFERLLSKTSIPLHFKKINQT